MLRRPRVAGLILGLSLFFPGAASAGGASLGQRLDTDPEPPFPFAALALDGVGSFRGRLDGRLAFAPHRLAAVFTDVGLDVTTGRGGRLGVTLALLPGARGLEGAWLGLGVDLTQGPPGPGGPGPEVGPRVEGGIQGVWDGLLGGASVGVAVPTRGRRVGWGLLRLRLWLGWCVVV